MYHTEHKSLLAKLLAAENIQVRQSPTARTAAFDVKNRILEMPIWKGISEDLNDMLLVHETGHALDTPGDGWISAITTIALEHHANVTDAHKSAVRGFLNVVEDARIDKRQKRRYPGSKKNYLVGYKELEERGFFGTPGADYNSYDFIDRLNIYFKGGFSKIKFSKEEMPFVKRAENTETWDDVVRLTSDIYGFAKSKGQNSRQYQVDEDEDMMYGFADEDADGESDQDFEPNSDDVGSGADGETGDDGESEEDGESGDAKTKGSGSTKNDDYIPESKTNEIFEHMQQNMTGSSESYQYLTIPVPYLDRIVDDYKVVLEQHRNHYNRLLNMNPLLNDTRPRFAEQFQKFRMAENNTLSFMIKEFETKKAADIQSRISVAKTGVIDPNKLHSYRYSEDIFRRLSTLPQGKNHGFVMFLDWSGSMQTNLDGTIKQLLSLTMFCKKVQIPFEVYTFRVAQVPLDSNFGMPQFNYKKGDLEFTHFRIRNILSSRMNIAELNEAYVNLWCYGDRRFPGPDRLSSTPLNGAAVVAPYLIKEFQTRNKVQIVSTIFLTDGESDPVGQTFGGGPFSNFPKNYVLQDEKTRKNYHILSHTNSQSAYGYGNYSMPKNMTAALLKHIKDRTGCNMIGFYLHTPYKNKIDNLYRQYSPMASFETIQKIKEEWKDNKFITVTSAGYDEYYVINAGTLSDIETPLVIKSNMTKSTIAKAFAKFSQTKAVNRVLLKRFINKIASIN